MLFTWELVSHTHTQTQTHTHTQRSRQPALFGSCWQKHFFAVLVALASTKHPHHHQLFTTSAACVCIRVCVCGISVCMTVCAVTICSHRIFGEPRSTAALSESDSPLCFLEHGLVSVDIRRARTRCFNYGLASADSHRVSSVWGLFTVKSRWLFSFLWHLVLSPSELLTWTLAVNLYLPCSWIYFVDLSKCLKQIICSLCPGDI